MELSNAQVMKILKQWIEDALPVFCLIEIDDSNSMHFFGAVTVASAEAVTLEREGISIRIDLTKLTRIVQINPEPAGDIGGDVAAVFDFVFSISSPGYRCVIGSLTAGMQVGAPTGRH